MTEERERRYSKRYHFNDGKVYCQENSTFGFFKQFSEPFNLNDLTKSGISFITTKKVSRGDEVNLKIDIPGQTKIRVKQFDPFGRGSRAHNAPVYPSVYGQYKGSVGGGRLCFWKQCFAGCYDTCLFTSCAGPQVQKGRDSK